MAVHRFAPLVAALLALVPAAHAGTPNPNRTLALDAVELAAGREVPGDPARAIRHGRHVYLFASDASRAMFVAHPERYEIQVGGACGRMGPFSGMGTTDIHAVHDGKLYIFASEGCRKTFLSRPHDLLESDDPVPAATEEQLARGRQLVALALAGLGGAAAVDAVRTYQEGTVSSADHEGKAVEVARVMTHAFPDRVRLDSRWGPWHSSWLLAGAESAGHDNGESFALHDGQRRGLARRALRSPLALLRLRDDPGFRASSAGPVSIGEVACERVAIAVRGVTVTLALDLATGRALQATYRGEGPGGFLTHLTRAYSDFQRVGDLVLPRMHATTAEGQPPGEPVRVGVLAVNAWHPPEFFATTPAQPPSILRDVPEPLETATAR